MAYSSGMIYNRVKVAKRASDAASSYGKGAGGVRYTILGTFWAAEDFNRGTKSLREGAYDAYDTVMFRMRFTKNVDRWCLIQYNRRWYEIQSLNEDHIENKIIIRATEMTTQVNIVPRPEPEPSISDI